MLGAGRDRRQAALPLGASRREEATSWDPHPSLIPTSGGRGSGISMISSGTELHSETLSQGKEQQKLEKVLLQMFPNMESFFVFEITI